MSSSLNQRNNNSSSSNNHNNKNKHKKTTSGIAIGDRPTKRQRRDNPATPLDHVSLDCVATPHGPILTPILVSTIDKEIILTRIENEIVLPFQLKLSLPRKPRTRTASSPRKDCKQQQQQAEEREDDDGQITLQRIIPPHKSLARRILDSRCHIGINSCTRMIELSLQTRRTTMTTTTTTTTTTSRKSMQMLGDNTCRISLIIACRDIHPPTTHAHVPFLLSQLQEGEEQDEERKGTTDLDTPVLMLLPGKASLELGRALGIKKCSILCFTSRNMELEGLREGLVDCSEEVDKYHAKIDSFVEFCKSKMHSS
ncbi:hypothetical protein MHU86_13978 [Fragilaria crotonensis]|nr:hypothetical protein MHU86_13978 [Fragilaria crotonensis]